MLLGVIRIIEGKTSQDRDTTKLERRLRLLFQLVNRACVDVTALGNQVPCRGQLSRVYVADDCQICEAQCRGASRRVPYGQTTLMWVFFLPIAHSFPGVCSSKRKENGGDSGSPSGVWVIWTPSVYA
jgi:hypothetical protein